MNVAVLTYEFANPQAVLEGCPPNWPYSIQDIGEATQLPKSLQPPWRVMSRAELDAQMKAMEAEKEAFNAREPADVTSRKQLIADILSDLRAIRQSSGTLTAAQISNAMRQMAKALLLLIEEDRVNLK